MLEIVKVTIYLHVAWVDALKEACDFILKGEIPEWNAELLEAIREIQAALKESL